MPRRFSLVAVAVLLAVPVGGCADGKVKEANAYVSAVNEAQNGFAATSEKLLGEITPDSPGKQDRTVLRRFYAAVDRFVEQLRAIEPPARVRSLHEKLTAAMVRFGASLRSAGDDITSRRASRVLDGQQKLAAATAGVSKTINATIAAINTALKS